MECPVGFKVDGAVCALCECVETIDDVISNSDGVMCDKGMCLVECPEGFANDDNGCVLCECLETSGQHGKCCVSKHQ